MERGAEVKDPRLNKILYENKEIKSKHFRYEIIIKKIVFD